MMEVTVTMREIFDWIPKEKKLYLVTNKTGAHGTGNAINQYTQILEGQNIEIIWQVPRSLETNLLDLGLWMTIQKMFKNCTVECGAHIHAALAKNVSYA